MSACLRIMGRAAVIAAIALSASMAPAQVFGPPVPSLNLPAASSPLSGLLSGADKSMSGVNPLEVLDSVGRQLPGEQGKAGSAAPMGGLSPAINILLLLTVVSLAPSIMLMTTCFVRITVVLGLLKQAIGTASVPPPQVTVGLALFMTMLVMAPTAQRVYDEAVVPYQKGTVQNYDQLWDQAKQPVRDFMFAQIEVTGNWSSLYMILEYRGIDASQPEKLTRANVDMVSLVPAYMLSELKTAFLLGFRVYLPFLIIDIVISSLLISMSMMMLPPVLVSLPFKLLLFVLVDGWTLVVGSLMHGFKQPVAEHAASMLPPELWQSVFAMLC